MGSSLANQSSFQSKALLNDSDDHDNSDLIFKTANNSINLIAPQNLQAAIVNDKRGTPVMDKLKSKLGDMYSKYNSGQFSNRNQSELMNEMFQDFFKAMSMMSNNTAGIEASSQL